MDAAAEQPRLPKEIPHSTPAAEAPMNYGALESHMHCLMAMNKNASPELHRLDRVIRDAEKYDGAESVRRARGALEGGLSSGQETMLERLQICKQERLDVIKARCG